MNPIDAAKVHEISLSWLKEKLTLAESRTTVVFTHHAPSARSLPIRQPGELTGAAYASNLDHIVESHNVSLWIHGHVHNGCDYRICNTRVFCNPRTTTQII
ncbi:metallophosphoesterase [Zhongshania aliphaticivorans]|uniref:metallophosphoesterase n=1 Tax=Zhongshania aliphaticivorans TaxID=1470434 RepID=UPI001F41C245|nr:metallophosphoesterase [Zhongshania aliphaticivorans]